MSLRTVKTGQALFEEGDVSRSAYFIKKGMLRIYKKKGDTSIEIETIRAGQLIGELAFLDEQPRSASAEAIIDTEVVEISQTILEETLSKTPDWLKVLLKTISARLRTATNKIKILESATTAYETDKYGTRSKEFVYLNRGELLRFCAGLLAITGLHGEEDSLDGIRFPLNLFERFTSQIIQINEGKVLHLIELFKTVHLFKTGPDSSGGANPTLYLSDAEFIEKLIWFINEQNSIEASKLRVLTPRGFMILGLLVKHIYTGKEDKNGKMILNMTPVLASEGGVVCSPPLRADEMQELIDQKFVDSIAVASGTETNLTFNRDKIMFEFKVFWVLNELDKLNEKKRKTK